MRLILGVDAIFPPLTGIGRYAATLFNALHARDDIEALRCYAHGRWLPREEVARLASAATGNADRENPADTGAADGRDADRLPLSARLRHRVARLPLATRAYGALMPAVGWWRLRGLGDHLFHSPNFILPPFPGPSVATVHDLSTLRYPEFHPAARLELMQRALPEALSRAAHIVTPSAAVRDELLEAGLAEAERVSVTALGVNPEYGPEQRREAGAALPIADLRADGYLLSVATLEPRKNIDGLLNAYGLLPEALRRRYPLVLAGAGGWNSQPTQARIDGLVAAGAVRQLGYVPEQLLPLLLANARCFVFPSFYEGFGLPVLEAMASGTPVVTSMDPALREVGAEAVLAVPADDSTALAEALQRAAEDRTWRAAARTLGLERARRFTWERCVAATVAVYRRLQ